MTLLTAAIYFERCRRELKEEKRDQMCMSCLSCCQGSVFCVLFEVILFFHTFVWQIVLSEIHAVQKNMSTSPTQVFLVEVSLHY